MTAQEITNELKRLSSETNRSYDIRIRGALPRAIDQKVTPDVLAAVAVAIKTFGESEFTTTQVRLSDAINNEIRINFGKPETTNHTVYNEYDKFIGQIFNTLEFANVIAKVSNHKFKILSHKIIDELTVGWQASTKFLACFITLYLIESGAYTPFDNYLSIANPTNNDLNDLKSFFIEFMYKYTNIKRTPKEYEPRRIFAKVLNPLACTRNTFGVKGGWKSEDKITMNKLLYSASINPRDLTKKKGESRADFEIRTGSNKKLANIEAAMKRYAKESYNFLSAVSGEKGVEAHHILMSSEYPQYSASPENLIALTSQEHRQKAHPNGHMHVIDKKVQLELLKIQKKHIISNPDMFSIDVFNDMLETAGIQLD